ncbi:MAG TPA: hypothetical protein P5174_00665 [Dysgonamonadaceae bacterium]|jgi:hypothetical protein|nr:hypothetical protein [Dysgonamonadaceae bacterium]
MSKLKITTIAAVLLWVASCAKDDKILLTDSNYLIFGRYYGMCVGDNCILTYKLTGEKLYEDTRHNYLAQNFNFIELGEDKFELVKDLTQYFPAELLSSKDSIFGCPDCGDQGGLLVKYVENGKEKTWRIDQSKSAIPIYLHNFIDKLNEKITLINDK